jgi:hypothetical protein
VRSQDASFVLDSLSQVSTAKRLIPGARSGFDVRRVAMCVDRIQRSSHSWHRGLRWIAVRSRSK